MTATWRIAPSRSPETAADHEAIAAYFEAEAKEALAAAERHRRMGETYKRGYPRRRDSRESAIERWPNTAIGWWRATRLQRRSSRRWPPNIERKPKSSSRSEQALRRAVDEVDHSSSSSRS